MKIKQLRHPFEDIGEDVEVDGAVLPQSFPFEIELEETTVRLQIGLVRGQWQCTELRFVNPTDAPLDPAVVETVVSNLPNIVRNSVNWVEQIPWRTSSGRPSAANHAEFKAALDHRQRRRVIDDEHLKRVAEVYESSPDKPLKAVALYFPTSEATASRWIKLARERGFLKPKDA